MLTIFTIPKPFQGHNKIIQRNAIKSWMKQQRGCEIILFGDDEGVAETARELGIKHVPFIEKNELGTPLLSPAFICAQRLAKNDILVYANADVIFIKDLEEAIRRVDKPLFLLCGRRWDLDIKEEIDFEYDRWTDELNKKIKEEGKLHGFSGIDYFVFPRNLINMPAFTVGRPGWDSWLIYFMRSRKIPVIDVTKVATVIHQNHEPCHSKFSGPEWQENIKIAGGLSNMLSLRDADWVLNENGLNKPDFPVSFFSFLSLYYPWRLLLAFKRKVQIYISQTKQKLGKFIL